MLADNLCQEIVCQQVLVADASVFSIQWSIFPREISAGLAPSMLLDRYLGFIRKTTLSLIRPVSGADGIEFRLLMSRLSLISFLHPTDEENALVMRICGGVLVQKHQCDRGELRFMVAETPAGIKVTLQLSDYCPLILGSATPSKVRFWLYRLTQAAIHRLVTVRFLVLLYRELAGSTACVQVISGQIREGQPL
jgi:hypothetical protein